MDTFKTCFSNHVLRPNYQAMEVERSTYTGGFTCVLASLLKCGISVDVNSEYPTSMCNVQPWAHCNTKGECMTPNESGYMPKDYNEDYVDATTICDIFLECSILPFYQNVVFRY